MIAAPVAASWDALDELEALPTPPLPPRVSLAPPSVPAHALSCTLPPAIYDLHSTIQIKEGETVTPVNKVKALKRLKEKRPLLHDLYLKQVTTRMNVKPAKRLEALAALVGHLHVMGSGVVAEQLVALDWLLNQGVYNGKMYDHLAAQRALWDECDKRYMEGLSADEMEFYNALDPDEQAAFRILRDLAIIGNGEFFMSCDQLKSRIGTSCNGHRMLNNLGDGCYCIITKIKDGQRREAGVRSYAATYRWLLPLPAPVAAVAA